MQYNRAYSKKICVFLSFLLILMLIASACGKARNYDAVNTDIVASVNGELIYLDDLLKETARYGQISNELAESLLDSLIDETLALQQAEAEGFSPLTEEETELAERTADGIIDERYQYYYAQIREEYPDESDEAIHTLTQEAVAAYVAESGETAEFLTKQCINSVILEKLQDDLTDGITVTEDEIYARYEEYVAQDQKTYSEHPEYFESDKTTNAVYYNLAGYRYVKHIRLSSRETAEEVLQLTAARDFDELMAEYTEDTASLDYPHGFAVGEDSHLYIEGFAEAALALVSPGDISPVTELQDGFYIIKYEQPIIAGAEDFSSMQQYVENDLLNEKCSAAYSEALAQWREKAEILIFRDVLDTVLNPDQNSKSTN